MYFSFSVEFGLGQRDSQKVRATPQGHGTSIVTWNRLRELVKKRDGLTCQYCGEFAPDGAADHIVSLAKGGTDSIDNLTWSCLRCNSHKGSQGADDWERPEGAQSPQALRIEIVPTPQSEPTLWDVDSKRVTSFARAALSGFLTQDASKLSRRKFTKIRNEALRRGLVAWKNPTSRTQGLVITPMGTQVFEAILAGHEADLPGVGGACGD